MVCICVFLKVASAAWSRYTVAKKLFHIDLINTLVAFQSEISKRSPITRIVHVFSEQPSYMNSSSVGFSH